MAKGFIVPLLVTWFHHDDLITCSAKLRKPSLISRFRHENGIFTILGCLKERVIKKTEQHHGYNTFVMSRTNFLFHRLSIWEFVFILLPLH